MTILDIFSWLPAKEISLEEIEKIVMALYEVRTSKDGYALELDLPKDADENVIGVTEDLVSEDKKVCYLMRDRKVIAAIGYRDDKNR